MDIGLEVIKVSMSIFLISLLYWLARLIPPALAGLVYLVGLFLLKGFIAGWSLFFAIGAWFDSGWMGWLTMAILWIVPALVITDVTKMLVVKKKLFVGWQSIVTFVILWTFTYSIIGIPYRNLDEWLVGQPGS